MLDTIHRAQKSALSRVRGLFKAPGEPGYNPDAEKTWKECTVATRAALALTQGTIAAERAASANNAQPRMLGVVAVMPRIENSSEWEAFARQVHERPQLAAIDVVSTPVPTDETK